MINDNLILKVIDFWRFHQNRQVMNARKCVIVSAPIWGAACVFLADSGESWWSTLEWRPLLLLATSQTPSRLIAKKNFEKNEDFREQFAGFAHLISVHVQTTKGNSVFASILVKKDQL